MAVREQIAQMAGQVHRHRENGKHAKANKLAAQMLRTLSNLLARS
jgi:hypothetical protein